VAVGPAFHRSAVYETAAAAWDVAVMPAVNKTVGARATVAGSFMSAPLGNRPVSWSASSTNPRFGVAAVFLYGSGELPVIALTGQYEDYAKANGFDAFLKKPVDFDQLCDAIAALVGHRRRSS